MRKHIASFVAGQEACVLCTEGRKARAFHNGHYGGSPYHHKRRWEMSLSLRKPVGRTQGAGGSGSPAKSDWSKWFPALYEFLTCAVWPEDGSKRALPGMSLWLDEESWKCCLRDKACSRVGFVSGATPEAVLEALDRQLAEDRVDWRKDRPVGRGRS